MDLGTLGGSFSEAAAVSDSGRVVGSSATSADPTPHAFLWTREHGMRDLGTLGGSHGTVAYAVSNTGHVVGTGWMPGTRRSTRSSGPRRTASWISAWSPVLTTAPPSE